MAPRSLLIDSLKFLAAQLIVLHHIVLYAPMADLVARAWPAATAFLIDEARYVVQIFLVIGGFLAAQSLSRGVDNLPRALLARYLRLVPMLAVALLAVLAASALLPLGRWPDWVTPWPTIGQFIAHLLLLQDVLHIPSLSAGAWYVSIDFQLYALLAIGAATLPRRVLPWAATALSVASLVGFSRDDAFNVWALYFFGAYGLGALAAWVGRSRPLAWLFGSVCTLHLAIAGFEARPRVALACLTAIALATSASRWQAQGCSARWLGYWSNASYGVFLIHYAVIVAITALWLRLGLHGPTAAWTLLIACWAASLAAGAALQRWVGALPFSRAARRPDAGPGPPAPRRCRDRSTAAPRPRTQPVGQPTGKVTDRPLDREGQRREHQPEHQHRQGRMPGLRRHELRQESEVEDRDLRVGDVGQRTIHKQTPRRAPGPRRHDQRRIARAQQADAEPDQVGRAGELEHQEQPFGGAQNRPQPQRGQQRVADETDADAGRGGHAGCRALRDRARHHQDHVLARA